MKSISIAILSRQSQSNMAQLPQGSLNMFRLRQEKLRHLLWKVMQSFLNHEASAAADLEIRPAEFL